MMLMILTRAPMRISFVGGGTDLSTFYTKHPGRVVSATIDKYVYVTINCPPLMRHISARYSISELVENPEELRNDRIREALIHFGIKSHIDIGSFSDVPVKTGLGSSSSFSVALMKALSLHKGKLIGPQEAAELAAHLEIDLIGEPIGKQDQYAAALGGFNCFQFNPDHSVKVTPIHLDYKIQSDLERHTLVFYTGVTRLASSILTEQKANTEQKFETLKKMADLVTGFHENLLIGDFKALGEMLQENWIMKKSLASGVSNSAIDDLYSAGVTAGAWGGKILGAGGGGCVMFIAPPAKKEAIRAAVTGVAQKNELSEFIEMPIRFVKSGVETILNQDNGRRAIVK